MDLSDIVSKLLAGDDDHSNLILSTSQNLTDRIKNGHLKIIDVVKGIDPVLTNGSHNYRLKGVELLVKVITSLPNDSLNEKEIEVLNEFICLRLIDHRSMEPVTLSCISYFVDCKHKPARYNSHLLNFIKTKLSVQKMDVKTRNQVYRIVQKIVLERRQASCSIDSDIVYSLVHIIEGENNPENLMLCFSLVSYILMNFSELEPFIDDLFEWLASYYPVDYTPKTAETANIQRSDLVQALYDCFFASPLCADNLQTLLLEKLDSNLMSTKLESLSCLTKCYEVFPLSSIRNYNSTLWTSIRMSCLKKSGMVDQALLTCCLNTMSALARKLCEDGDLYFTFVSDMYEELALAFRKPEMELFEPATKLLTHAILPSIVGFNYILSKILPISLNAFEAQEYRPLAGLAYLFEQLHLQHPESKLKSDLNDSIAKLVDVVSGLIDSSVDALRVLMALIQQKLDFNPVTLKNITNNLWDKIDNTNLDLEGCLALLCLKYGKMDLICNSAPADLNLNSLIVIIHNYNEDNLYQIGSDSVERKQFSIYLRILKLKLDEASKEDMDSLDYGKLNDFLTTLRKFALRLYPIKGLIEKIAHLYSIAVNKLNAGSVNRILMDYFGSPFCQKLVPATIDGRVETEKVYLPILRWIFKSLVVRNHQLAGPLINLLLNFITSDKVDLGLALYGCQVFRFILEEDDPIFFVTHRHYERFFLYKQKFYSQTSKEIKLRYEMHKDDHKRNLLLCSISVQVPHLPLTVYNKDRDWLLRQLLRVLSTFQLDIFEDHEEGNYNELLLSAMYGCAESLIQKDICADMTGFISSLVDINLKHAQEAKTMQVRQKALSCLANIASSFNETDLLVLRHKVVDELRHCLSDKKRLVRQAAADARLKWVLIGQPVGGP